MRLKSYLRTILLGGCFIILTSCAAWRSGQDTSSIIDGNASNVQPTGLGEDPSVTDNAGQGDLAKNSDQDLAKRTYYFDFDRSFVRDQDRSAIEANAQYLISHPNAKALVEGHTDPRGSREYNIALGERRSKAIEALLKENGVKPVQIRIISYGAEKPASNGRSDADYQLDRRGVLVYLQQ